jgi:signal transduction histidine kinase
MLVFLLPVSFQPAAPTLALLWGILFLLAGGLSALWVIYKIRRDREKQRLRAERDALRAEIENLWRVSDTMTWSLPIEKSLVRVIKTIKEITGAHRVLFYLFDIRQEFLYAVAESDDLSIFSEVKLVPKSFGRLPLLFDSLKPIIIEDLLQALPEDRVPPEVIKDGNRAVIVVPLLVEQEVLGFVDFLFDHFVEWTEEKVAIFNSIGRLVGKNIKNAKNSENLRELAVLQERKHLSHELHDNFSQLTSALGMRAEAARLSYEEGRQDKLGADLDRIINTAHEIQGVLREEMIALHNSVDEHEDLLPFVRTYVERFQISSHIVVTLDEHELPGPVIVPTQVGSQFIRILQESLSNVRRHSRATQVVIRIMECSHRLCLEVEDDGQGFDVAAIPEDRLGLQIMRERAQEVGGKVSIRSSIGSGTCVRVELPVVQFSDGENEV